MSNVNIEIFSRFSQKQLFRITWFMICTEAYYSEHNLIHMGHLFVSSDAECCCLKPVHIVIIESRQT